MAKKVSESVGDAIEQVRTPLLAALGAGDLATQAVTDVLKSARSSVTERQRPSVSFSEDVSGLKDKVETSEFGKLTDLDELRKFADPSQLRELVDAYTKAATDLYKYLASHGESTFDKLRKQPQVRKALDQLEEAVNGARDKVESQPQVRKALDQLEEAVNAAQERLSEVTDDIRERAEDVFAKVTKRTKAASVKTAEVTERVADTAADAVSETGKAVADKTTKVAAKATPRKTTSTARTTSTTTKKTTK
ncbi:MAG: hypothetical protein J2O49_02900 [Sciscionella sp.]|nr:hypothetical protein [Sciscionella sp.]